MDKLTTVVIKVTDLCNFNCTYCFEKESTRRKNHVFNKEKELLELLKKFDIDEKLDIRFFGGEMFLYPERIEAIHNEIKKLERTKDTHIHFAFVTNGSMPENMIDLIQKDIFDLDMCKISWDGLCSHYTRGYKRYDNDPMFSLNMIDNIKKLAPYCKEKVLISMAITKDNVRTLYHTYQFLNDLGYKKFEYYIIFDSMNIAYYNRDLFLNDLYNELTSIMNDYDKNVTKLHNYELYKGTYDYAHQCRTLGNQLHINTDGNIFACNLLDEMEYFDPDKEVLGNVSNYDIKEINKWLDNVKENVSFKFKEFCQDICDCQYSHFCNICPLIILLYRKSCKNLQNIVNAKCPYMRFKEVENAAFNNTGVK